MATLNKLFRIAILFAITLFATDALATKKSEGHHGTKKAESAARQQKAQQNARQNVPQQPAAQQQQETSSRFITILRLSGSLAWDITKSGAASFMKGWNAPSPQNTTTQRGPHGGESKTYGVPGVQATVSCASCAR